MAVVTTPASAGGTAAADAVRRRIAGRSTDVIGVIFKGLLIVALLLTILVLWALLYEVITGGWDVLSGRLGDFLTGRLTTRAEAAGVAQGLAGSFWIAVFVVTLSFPVGIGAAIYLEEYAPQSRFTRLIDVNIRNLAGVPSVVYGILGFAVFVKSLESVTGGRTMMAAGITLAVLVLPIVIITAAEAIRAVPDSIREAGFGVGATRWEVVRSHVLPYAAPGILTGTVLALARALGEAAPLILVGAVTGRLGASYELLDPSQLQERFTAMPIVIFAWAGQPNADFRALTAAAIVVLLVVVLLANTGAILLRNRYEKKR
ncbi:MAG: phosphate ABC transporter permease PstA [Acidimicrobiia bacterium]|nr:phosphate ABC transporter permease PstA [Acidimicrobiia bacterium]